MAADDRREGVRAERGFVVHRSGPVAVVTIDRPAARNALTADMRRHFGVLVSELDGAEDIRAIVLTGAEPSFSAGVDVKERLAGDRPPPLVRPNPGEVLRSCATPVIAAVNGPCVAGGLEMALSCTFILASDRATFRDTHARLGLMPGWGLSALLPRAVGVRLAREMTLTGRPLEAEEAQSAGLVNRVCPHEELMDQALQAARALSEADPRVVRAALDLYRRGTGVPLDVALRFEREAADAWRTDSSRSLAEFDRLTDRGSPRQRGSR